MIPFLLQVPAEIRLEMTKEEGKPVLLATVTRDGKPLEGVPVRFLLKRSFGEVRLGEDRTLEDGTAALPFPAQTPGELLEIRAEASEPALSTRAAFPGRRPPPEEPFPRALWAPRAPLPLLLSFALLLGGIWTAYAFVARQILCIRKGGQP